MVVMEMVVMVMVVMEMVAMVPGEIAQDEGCHYGDEHQSQTLLPAPPPTVQCSAVQCCTAAVQWWTIIPISRYVRLFCVGTVPSDAGQCCGESIVFTVCLFFN